MEWQSSIAVQLTAMLKAWRSGDHSALEELAPMIYEEPTVSLGFA